MIRCVLISLLAITLYPPGIHAEVPPKIDKKVRRVVLKRLKESVRERFQHRNLKEFLVPYAPQVTITYGRKAQADRHDYVLTLKQRIAQLKRKWRIPLSGSEDVFFTRTKVTRNSGGGLTVEARIAFHFFGGRLTEARRYQLEDLDGEWKVISLRTWPISEDVTGLPKEFNEKYWSTYDKKISDAQSAPSNDFVSTLSLYIEGHWFAEAYRYAKETSISRPTYAEAWKASAALAHKLGDSKKALRFAQTAIKLDPKIDIPEIFKGH